MSDLMPNDGSFFMPDKDEATKQELSKERSETLQALPMLEDIIDWFSVQADETNRMTNLDYKSDMPLKSQVLAYQLLADLLLKKKGELSTKFETYKPKQRK